MTTSQIFTRAELQTQIRAVSYQTFDDLALAIFRYQATHNTVYASYLKYLKKDVSQIKFVVDIPFMPIGFFKNHRIVTGLLPTQTVFESSGTTGIVTSQHHVADTDWYNEVSSQIFEQTYDSLGTFQILALLPSYLERNNSSLVYMIDQFIQKTNSTQSGFFLHNVDNLLETLKKITQPLSNTVTLLWGVTFALLDLAESGVDLSFLRNIPNLIVMETGGMKGRRREMLREELHTTLTEAFGVAVIHSEYGMTELLSQAYSKGHGIFETPPTMKILLRDINDPFAVFDQTETKKTGGINVIDLANLDSCSFIETQDLGRFGTSPNSFEVIGRFDNSDVRGCNLMVL
jgi:Acyl-protein synthetase, LuxE